MKFIILSLSVAALAGCSSVPTRFQDQETRGSISFVNIEKLEMGESKTTDVDRTIGRPDEIKPFRGDTELWTYLEGKGDQKSQRLNLVVDRNSGRILSAAWIPRSGEALSTEKGVLAHFSEAKFSSQEIGRVVDAYSGDITYQDRAKGISFYVTETRREVEAIGFVRSENRVPTTQQQND